jgi:hypothetical protein
MNVLTVLKYKNLFDIDKTCTNIIAQNNLNIYNREYTGAWISRNRQKIRKM